MKPKLESLTKLTSQQIEAEKDAERKQQIIDEEKNRKIRERNKKWHRFQFKTLTYTVFICVLSISLYGGWYWMQKQILSSVEIHITALEIKPAPRKAFAPKLDENKQTAVEPTTNDLKVR